MSDKKVKVKVTEPETEESGAVELYYEINTGGGDVYFTVNSGRNSQVEVMSGEAPPPPRPPRP